MAYPVIWAPTDDHDKISDPFFSKHPRDIFKVELVKEWVEKKYKVIVYICKYIPFPLILMLAYKEAKHG